MIEQLKSLWEWYLSLFSDSNSVRIAAWSATIITLTSTFSFILKPSRNFILKKIRNNGKRIKIKRNSVPQFEISYDEHGNSVLKDDKNFAPKIELAKYIYRSQNRRGISVKVTPDFSTRKLQKYDKQVLEIQLQNIRKEIEKKLDILLSRQIDISLYQPENVKIVINKLLEKQNPNVTGKTKIELYRAYDPKIYFPVYLTKQEMQSIANHSSKSYDDFFGKLRIPTLVLVSDFPNDILLQRIIPSLIREIYRISEHHNFDLSNPHWENIHSYEVGLG